MVQQIDRRRGRRSLNSDLVDLLNRRRERGRSSGGGVSSGIVQSLATQALAQTEIQAQMQEQQAALAPQAALPSLRERPPSPGILEQLLGPLRAFQERVLEPGAGVLTEAVQRVIPGEQEIERKTREFQAQGIGPIESRRRAFVESDLPATTLSLPFRIPLPGDRSLQDIAVGVKGAIEVAADPLNLLLGIGIGPKLLAKGAIPLAITRARAAKAIPVADLSKLPDVPAMQVELPGFRSAQNDLMVGRMQALVDAGETTDVYDAMVKAVQQEAADAGLSIPTTPGALAAHFGSAANDPVGGFTEVINQVPGEPAGRAALRTWGGKRQVAGLAAQEGWERGQRLMRDVRIGRAVGQRQVVGRKEMEGLFKALHDEGPVPDGMQEVFDDLRGQVGIEQADMLNADPNMAKSFAGHPSYFFRGWRQVRRVGPIKGGIGTKPGFEKPRIDSTFTEMLEQGWEPISWNPYDMVVLRRIAGVEYRENVSLIDKLTRMDQIIPVRFKSEVPKGWRVPEVGPAFEGKPYVGSDGQIRSTALHAVPNKIANVLELSYGKPPGDIVQKIQFFSGIAKRAKLFGSLFQHIDFALRAGAVAFTPTGIARGAPLKYPSLIARLMNVSLRKVPRDQLRARILSDTPMFKDSDISLRMIAEEGWQVGGDTSLLRRGILDFLEDSTREAPAGVASITAARIGNMAKFMEDGLFDGVYRESQVFALENFVVPALRKAHPDWTTRQVASSAAEEINKMFSTLAPWQQWFNSPTGREFARALFFSANESQSWIQQALSAAKGPNVRLWREYGVGMMLYLGGVANVISISSTGEPLPLESYLPVTTGNPHSFLPNGISYNSRFLSPQLPFGARGDNPVYLDVVGQADTFFRWALDPPGALTARYNLLPRAIVNQARGSDFYGRPIDGTKERVRQALDDLFTPIGLGNLSDVLREQIPALRAVTVEREGRLGALGSLVQTTGLNLRAENTPDLLNRAAALSGFLDSAGQPIRTWQALEPVQRRELAETEPLASEMARRRLTSIEREATGAVARERLVQIDDARIDQETFLESEFLRGIVTGNELRDRYSRIQGEAAAKRIQVNDDFQVWRETGEKPEDKNRLALFEFYEAQNAATRESGIYDFDQAEKDIADLERAWTAEQKAFVERNSGLTKHVPLFRELRDGRQRWEAYWRVPSMVIKDPEALKAYEAFVGVFGEDRQDVVRQRPEFQAVARTVILVRERMRQLSSELDAFLFRYGYIGVPLHPANQNRIDELAPWRRLRRITALGPSG